MKSKLPDSMKNSRDEEWLDTLIKSVSTTVINGVEFPGFPSEELQRQYVGSANKQTLRAAFAFYKLVKECAEKYDRPLRQESHFLDFGCGWGRFLRFFWKDIDEDNLFGCDVDQGIVDICHSLNIPGQIAHIDPLGALPYPDCYFDSIMSYSVFTHLPEKVHLHWMKELARVARPNCVFCLTIEPRRFMDFIEKTPADTNVSWFKGLAAHKPRLADYYQVYDSGDLVFMSTIKGWEETYGDAVVPISFIKQKWSPHFDVRAIVDDPQKFWQAVVIVQRL
jgi:ubiquinone/menaquinone biosynthesis C-methylase UbiE